MGKQASFYGFEGPLFLASLKTLQDVYSENFCKATIIEGAKKIPEYRAEKHSVTDDGYEWYAGIYFSLPEGEVAILFPWTKRLSEREIKLSRPLAVYKRGVAPEEVVESIISRLDSEIKANRAAVKERLKGVYPPKKAFDDSWLYA
ncbi:hypothetical protein HYT00_02395 [Candidatus Giovannonibacteria bacterium]|nr:hypothetical protein [Candidatus Giovannonibacteria bacterium]